jgi:hypothetical protein
MTSFLIGGAIWLIARAVIGWWIRPMCAHLCPLCSTPIANPTWGAMCCDRCNPEKT